MRRVPLLVSIAGTLYPSLPLETLRLANQRDDDLRALVGRQRLSRRSASGRASSSVRVGSTVLPTDRDGELWLHFTRPDAPPLHLGLSRPRRHDWRHARSPAATS